MSDFIVDNYLLLMIGAAFVLFALIGFVVDMTKNKKNKSENLGVGDETMEDAPDIENVSISEDVESTDDAAEPEFVLSDNGEEPEMATEEVIPEDNLIPEVEDNN